MKLINISINKYFHMIPLWKSPIKLPVELPVDSYPLELPIGATRLSYPWGPPVSSGDRVAPGVAPRVA